GCGLASSRPPGTRAEHCPASSTGNVVRCRPHWMDTRTRCDHVARGMIGPMRIEFTLDCCDLPKIATFWQSAAGLAVHGTIEDRYVGLTGHGVVLTLQRVPEPKTVKNRMHIDLLVDDVEAEVQRLEGLGASRVTPTARQELGQTWFVLADPEGNEFCVAR